MKRANSPCGARLSPYEFSEDFPPRQIWPDTAVVRKWFEDVFAKVPLLPVDPAATPRERELCTWSATRFINMRREGRVTCEEFATALVKRARYCRSYNQWIFSSYQLFDKVVLAAQQLDVRAERHGIESIAPLYGLPIPMKGTAAVVDFPSGAGCGVLSGYVPVKNSALTQRILDLNGLIFGCTNVPEFACSWSTGNPASGFVRNCYGANLTVGGSSGGSASAVANFNCPIAVSEDTGGSTRVPAAYNQNFAFDPSRNRYPNAGNPGITYTNDQLGLNARDMDDLVLFDRIITGSEAAHLDAERRVAARPSADIRVVAPTEPFVDTISRPGLVMEETSANLSLHPELKAKLAKVLSVLSDGGFKVLKEEWPKRYFDYLGREENVAVESLFSGEFVNGKPIRGDPLTHCVAGNIAQWVTGYLDAPVSLKEILEDCGEAGLDHRPGARGWKSCDGTFDESQFRYCMGPMIRKDVEAYNSIFDEHGADLLLVPISRVATPDLAALADRSVPLPCVDGTVRNGGILHCCVLHSFAWKHLHLPRLIVPTGLTEDGRPTAIELRGRALPYELMFDDAAALSSDAEFLHLAGRVAAAIQAEPTLARVDAASVRPFLGA